MLFYYRSFVDWQETNLKRENNDKETGAPQSKWGIRADRKFMALI